MIPKRFEHVVFGFFLTFMMTFLIAGIVNFMALGIVPGFFTIWFWSWMSSWAVAFPSVLFVAPLTRRIVAKLVSD
ncbi:DUF2798 domain-containing protein [Alkalilacustris brevis]|uniref:DUF2798 domain-containing protein n=1 Tax=Alkalilacustris brevis TaxID=2026338 RepID=UPI000E0D7998|nr:DUF2798 domain-containing protein [Alkalilacustris brevis]